MALKKIRALIITKLNNNKPHRKSTKTTPDSHRINTHKLLLGYQQIRCHILRVQWQSVLIIFIASNSCQNKLAMSRTKGKTTNKTWKRKGIVFNSIFKISFQIWDVSCFWLVYRKTFRADETWQVPVSQQFKYKWRVVCGNHWKKYFFVKHIFTHVTLPLMFRFE